MLGMLRLADADVDYCRRKLLGRNSSLSHLRERIHETAELPSPNDVGLQVTVLPPQFFRTLHRRPGQSWRRSWTDLFQMVRPSSQMVTVAHLPDRANGSVTEDDVDARRIGVGLPGQAIFRPKGWVSNAYAVRIVGADYQDWPLTLDNMSDEEFELLPRWLRLGRSHNEMIRLKDLYSAAVAVGLQIATSPQPFGCVVAYAPRELRLTSDQIDRFGVALGTVAPQLSYQVAEDLRYPPLYEETNWDEVHELLDVQPPAGTSSNEGGGSGAG